MKKIIIFAVFVCIQIQVKGTELMNLPFTILTKDSVLISSVPYCLYGNLGQTTVVDKKTNTKLYCFNRYLKPNTLFSRNGLWRIELSEFGLGIWYKDQMTKYFSKKELYPIENINPIELPNGDIYTYDGRHWIIESFILEKYFYVLMFNGKLAKIDITNPKKEIPNIDQKTISFEEYNAIKNNADTLELVVNYKFEYPQKSDVALSDSVSIESKIQSMFKEKAKIDFNISIVVLFDNCVPKLVEYEEYILNGELVLIGNESNRNFLKTYKRSKFMPILKKFIENKSNWTCKIPGNIKWSFSYVIKIRK